ncbi:unnamed protein product [Rhizophagus irregularis]|nr:unnamed protein product [Rhizophagus irregularis]
MELQFFGDSIWRTSSYCFGSGNWINYCESKKCHHHSMKSCCQRLGNVLFPYTMNRIIFDIIGFEEWIFTERQQKMNICVVFASQPSLCSGESINFIRNWENNSNIQ